MIALGKVTEGENVEVEIQLMTDRIAITDVYLYYENTDILKRHYDVLKETRVDLKEVTGRKFEGKFETKEDGEYIVLSIPYDEGFSVKIDGKNVPITNVKDGFMGFKVDTKGEHEISLEFVPSGFVTGTVVSGFGVLMFAIWSKILKKNSLDE